MFLWLDMTSEGSTSGGTQSPLRSAGAPCDVKEVALLPSAHFCPRWEPTLT